MSLSNFHINKRSSRKRNKPLNPLTGRHRVEVSSFFEAHPHLEDNNEFRPEVARGVGAGVLQRARTLHFALPLL